MLTVKVLTPVVFVALTLSTSIAFSATSCKAVTKIKTAQQIEQLFAFDQARYLRSTDPKKADAILDGLTEMLEKDEIVKVEPLQGGVNAQKGQSFKLTMKSGYKAVFKILVPESKKRIVREVVAYKLSRLFGFDIVPPTTIRTISGEVLPANLQNAVGSMQLFITSAKPLEFDPERMNNPNYKLFKNGKVYVVEKSQAGRRLRLFDTLINNHDRGSNAGNYLVSEVDGYIFGIDHSSSFFMAGEPFKREDKAHEYRPEFLKRDPEFAKKLFVPTREQILEAMQGTNAARTAEFFDRLEMMKKDFENAQK